MTQDHDQDIAFLCVSNNIVGYLGYKKVKAAFPDISSDFRDFRSRIAYVAHFDDTKIAKLKNALANHPEAKSAIDRFFCNVLVREIGSDPCVENRRKLVFREFNSFIARGLYVRLEEAGVLGIDEWLKEIARYYEYDDDFTNFYLEGCCALAFQRHGMKVRMKPYCDGGPDLQVLTGCLSFDVEISRFRPDPSEVSLPTSGYYELFKKILDKSQNVWSKLEHKTKQLKEDKNGIIVLYSNELSINNIEFQKNAEYISCFGEKFCAVIFSDRTGYAKSLSNPRASIPVQQLSTNLRRMEYALLNLQRNYESKWVCDLRQMCDEHEHQYH